MGFLAVRRIPCRVSPDVLQRAILKKLSDALDSERRRGAGSESHRHAGLDVVVDSLVSDKLFEFVLRRRHGSDVGAAYFVRVAARCGGVVELERV